MDSPATSLTPDSVLESLALLSQEEPVRKLSGSTNKQSIQRVSYTHKDMADCILANPTISGRELAQRYGYLPHTVSLILNSDAFQAYLASRRQDLIDPILTLTVEERMRSVTIRSLDVIAEKLEMPAAMIPDELALRAATLGAKSLGMGLAPPAPPPPSVSLNDLAERLSFLARRPHNQGVVDVETREVSGPAAAYPGQPGAPALSNGAAQG